MSRTIARIALGLALVATPAVAVAQDQAKADPDQVVCKREKKVNSRFTTKTCYTRAQWAAIAEQNKRDFAEQRDRPAIGMQRDQ